MCGDVADAKRRRHDRAVVGGVVGVVVGDTATATRTTTHATAATTHTTTTATATATAPTAATASACAGFTPCAAAAAKRSGVSFVTSVVAAVGLQVPGAVNPATVMPAFQVQPSFTALQVCSVPGGTANPDILEHARLASV